jgi:hypothetical protein
VKRANATSPGSNLGFLKGSVRHLTILSLAKRKTQRLRPRSRAKSVDGWTRHQTRSLNDLCVPYGNHLEALKGDREGQHSIRVNNQWRICFRRQGQDAFDVEIVDYH